MILNRLSLLTLAFILSSACAQEAQSAQTGEPSDNPPQQNEERGERPPRPDLTEAAASLGISVADLQKAMKEAGGHPPNLEKVATALGISAEDLKAALPPPPRRPQR